MTTHAPLVAESKSAITVDSLVKTFGGKPAVDGVSFEVAHGEIFGVIGPDGGGKTTLFRMLVTLLKPDSGSASVLGHDVVRDLWTLRRAVGYMPGRFSLYPDLSVEENLRFFASVFGTSIDREREHIAAIYDQLAPFAARRAGALSGGMKQKLALCCALVHEPRILFLDEPTTGVDAVSRREFWDLLATLKKTGVTIVVSTPYMDEARRCDRIALMQHARMLAIDTPDAIVKAFDMPLFAVRTPQRYQTVLALRDHPHTRSVFPFGEVLHYTDDRPDSTDEAIARDVRDFLTARGITGTTVERIDPTVEDAFMARMAEGNGQQDRGAA